MIHVRITRHLIRFFPDIGTTVSAPIEVSAATVRELVRALDERYDGIGAYITDEHGSLRRHVNIFIDSEPIRDRGALSDPVSDGCMVDIMQALSGG